MDHAIRFLTSLDRILDSDDEAVSRERLENARRHVEAMRIADPGARLELGADAISWRGRAIASPTEFARVWSLRARGVERLSPPDAPDAFGRWVHELRFPAGSSAPEPADAQIESRRESVEPADAQIDSGRESVESATPQIESGRESVESATPQIESRRESVEPARREPRSVARALEFESGFVRSLHEEARATRRVDRLGTEKVVERLAAVEGDASATPIPLCAADEAYTTVHCLNTALLAIGLARHLAFGDDEVFELGIAALLHDLGMALVTVPPGLAPGGPDHRDVVRGHPSEGARALLDSGADLQLAAVVAYEHHRTRDGVGGYPARRFPIAPHRFSRVVALCDTYDVLRTERTFRPALSEDAARAYLRVLAGSSLDPELVTGFLDWLDTGIDRIETPAERPPAELGELGWLPETGFDPDLEPRPVRL